jgi:hypothetical protein
MDWLVGMWRAPGVEVRTSLGPGAGAPGGVRPLGAQALFGVVNLAVYHETAALVFLAIVASALVSLGVYHRGRPADERR